jgi:hypothetical protein
MKLQTDYCQCHLEERVYCPNNDLLKRWADNYGKDKDDE